MSTPQATRIVDERLSATSAATSPSTSAAAATASEVFVSFPHPSSLVAPRLQLSTQTQNETQTSARYVAGRVRVEGMTCDACVNSILRVLTDKYGLVDGAPGTLRSRALLLSDSFSIWLLIFGFVLLLCLL